MLKRLSLTISVFSALALLEPNLILFGNQKFLSSFLLQPASAQAADVMAATPTNLEATTWYLASGSQIEPLNNVLATIQFKAGKVSGTTGCNNFSGSYTVEGDQLAVGDALAITRKACPGELAEQEQQLLRAIPQIKQYKFTRQGYLELTYAGAEKSQTLVFIPESQLTPLHNTQWQLLSMAGKPPLSNPKKSASVQFMGNRIAGTGGCNRFTGTFSVEEDRLMVSDRMASTLMACPEPQMKQEQAFTQALAAATTYEIKGDMLVINYRQADQNQQLKFRPLVAAQKGVEKIVYVGPSKVNCVGVAPQKCLQIKEGSLDGNWQNYYSSIAGFDYEPGYTYKLRILEEKVENPPADASSLKWTLISIESKTPETTRALW